MTFLIAAAGTGGHVFPGLAVGEALIDLGVAQSDITYVGGDRLESTVYPEHGFRFIQVELAGLQRSMTWRNARLPGVVARARREIGDEMERVGVRVALGMGGYVTIPVGMAARRLRIPFFNAEQNAAAGLANRIASRWARATFSSFPNTSGLTEPNWVGNPVRRELRHFDRAELSGVARDRYGLDHSTPTLGVFGGSLGAGVLNTAVTSMLAGWQPPPIQVVHLTGHSHFDAIERESATSEVVWVRRAFEEQMEMFYAACDVVVARAGGAVAELTATATPSILVPGRFGSGGHQEENASELRRVGAALVLEEAAIGDLEASVRATLFDGATRESMAQATLEISKPDAAVTIAHAMIEAGR